MLFYRPSVIVSSIRRSNSSQERWNSSGRRLGIGGSKLAQIAKSNGIAQYASVIATSIQNNITTLECGLDAEDVFVSSLQQALQYCSDQNNNNSSTSQDDDTITITSRVGYRTNTKNDETNLTFSKDVTTSEGGIHNISSDYVQHVLETSPLSQLVTSADNNTNINWTCMIHNPEVQGLELMQKGASSYDVQDYLQEQLKDTFHVLDQSDTVTSIGICSNGLSLPSWHPLHLSWKLLLETLPSSSEKPITISLPMNLMETQGISIARQIKQQNMSSSTKNLVQIYSTRPLTCYPDLGTGTSPHSFNLVDYSLPLLLPGQNKTVMTNELKSIPMTYNTALNQALSHFDATHIVEKEHPLTTEERETLEACRLIQSMLHDLDQMVTNVRSLSAYESHLYSQVIPLLHESLEELDETSADVLQQFFESHGQAIRYTVAQNTRHLLQHHDDDQLLNLQEQQQPSSLNPNKNDQQEQQRYHLSRHTVPSHQTLQEYALQYLWEQRTENDDDYVIDKVIVGCPRPEYVIEAIQSYDKMKHRK